MSELDDLRVGDLVLVACPECRELFYEKGRFDRTLCWSSIKCGRIAIVIGCDGRGVLGAAHVISPGSPRDVIDIEFPRNLVIL